MGSYFSPIKDVLELTKSSGPVDVTPSSGLAPAVRQPLCQPSRGEDHSTPYLAYREYTSNRCLNLCYFLFELWQILKASRAGGALAGAGVCGRLGDLGCTSLPPITITSAYKAHLSFASCSLQPSMPRTTRPCPRRVVGCWTSSWWRRLRAAPRASSSCAPTTSAGTHPHHPLTKSHHQ